MNNSVRTWENLAGEIELTDAELAGVSGAGYKHWEDEQYPEHKKPKEKEEEKPCVNIFIICDKDKD